MAPGVVVAGRAQQDMTAEAVDEGLVAGAFGINYAAPLEGAAGGLPAYAVSDRREGRGGLMAVEVGRTAPARANELSLFQAGPCHGVLSPIAHGRTRDSSGRARQFVICQAPPGPALLRPGAVHFEPWDEAALLACLVRPAALALAALADRGMTHRGIRPDNLFRLGAGDPVVLGCAWAAPPAALQEAIHEPPYAAMCLPAGRGDGHIADDVYALGVTMVTLALGHVPLQGMGREDVIQLKLELGSFAALVGEARLPLAIQDLARGMLAEDPDHRPSPAMLADTEAARGRRVAARPPRRAQKVLEVGARMAWTARMLGFALACDPAAGLQMLQGGEVDRWLRRSLGDGALAARVEEAVRLRAAQGAVMARRDDAALVMRAVAILDPLAPLCWDGLALWPDGIGAAIASAEDSRPEAAWVLERLENVIGEEACGVWAGMRPERSDAVGLRLAGHQNRALLHQRGWAGGLPRLRYALNPLLPCRSGALRDEGVLRLAEFLPALERIASTDDGRGFAGLDHEMAAFLAARGDLGADTDMVVLADRRPDGHAVAALRLLSAVQRRTRAAATPGLTRWFGRRLTPALAVFAGRSSREQREAALVELSGAGLLGAMLAVIDDPSSIAADRHALAAATERVGTIDRQLEALRAASGGRGAMAVRLGQEAVTAVGLVALIYVIMSVVLA